MSDLTEDQVKAAEVAQTDPLCLEAVKALRQAAELKARAESIEAGAKRVMEMRFKALGAKEAHFDGDLVSLVKDSVGKSLDKVKLKQSMLAEGFDVSLIARLFDAATRETPKHGYIMFKPQREKQNDNE